MDARTGEVLLAENADTRLHPASLTKMMTLYIAFEAAERGEIDLDARTTVSARAAAEPGSQLGLAAGQRIALRHLVRAVAVKSANDAATALAEAIAGDEGAFVARMNATAASMGLRSTTFRNAHGLTAEGHLTTARDMSRLGRRLMHEYPGYFGLFSRLTADAGIARVAHTNRRFLSGFAGADGIKTGYTRAAGFNLTASARRGAKRLIVTVFGAPSSAARAARAGRLMEWGFARIPEDAAPLPPPPLGVVPPGGARDVAPPAAMAAARPLLPPQRASPHGAADAPAGGLALTALRPRIPRKSGSATTAIGAARALEPVSRPARPLGRAAPLRPNGGGLGATPGFAGPGR
jgi:D-alanyl-D-alanine carboxypeptidase